MPVRRGRVARGVRLRGACPCREREPGGKGRTLEEIERDVILATLKSNRGNKKKTAADLGIDRRTLYNKLKRWGMM
ncbi:MAG: hypothetical protein FJ109_09140 [Deltaproteobacteria bacterium]|nr:hypothetical protein [Deltaproteobacteria bacterium]